MNQKPPRRETTSPRRLAFAQIKLAKINLSLFGRLALSEVEDERRAVLLLSFDQDVEDVGLDGATARNSSSAISWFDLPSTTRRKTSASRLESL